MMKDPLVPLASSEDKKLFSLLSFTSTRDSIAPRAEPGGTLVVTFL